jgi:hypothetical protein
MLVVHHDRSAAGARRNLRFSRAACLAASLCACATAIASTALPGVAEASVKVVSSTADSGAGSLREALIGASPGDTIRIPTPGDYKVTSAELPVTTNVTIEGSGPTVRIVGDGNNRVFNVTAANVTLSDLTVTGGGLSGTVVSGGGIANAAGTLLLRDVTVTGNSVSNTIGGIPAGGGVFNESGTLQIVDSTISANTAAVTPKGGGIPEGGGVANSSGSVTITRSSITGNTASIAEPGGAPEGAGVESSSGTLTIADSTVSGNTNTGGSVAIGGGIAAFKTTTVISSSTVSGNVASEVGTGTVGEGGGIIQFQGSLSLLNSTIAANSAAGEFAEGGGLQAQETSVAATNSTIAANVVSGATAAGGNLLAREKATVKPQNTIIAGGTGANGANCSVQSESAIQSQGHNLDSLDECSFTATGDLVNADPLLAPLANNGGATQTMALASASPAIDAADGAACPPTDQRGVLRPAGAGCDIGAFELATPTATSGQASGVGRTSATLAGLAANPELAGASTRFQYGTTTAYGLAATGQGVGPTTAQAPITASVGGLAPGTTYHFRLVVQNGVGTAYGAERTFTTAPAPGAPARPSTAPKLTNVAQSHARWREGRKLAALSRRSRKKAPLGTTFSFTLDQRSSVRFAFTQQADGRKVAGRCVAKSRKNRHKRSCKRTLARGALAFAAHAGANKLAFQGLLARSKKLPLGRYTLLITATNKAGQRSHAQALRFAIVR